MKAKALVFAALAAAVLGGGAGARGPDPVGELVVSADLRPRIHGEIYRIEPQGRRTNLSRSPYWDRGAVVSPDGRRVAFFSDRDGRYRVYVASIGGGPIRMVANLSPYHYATEMAWAPDSRRIALVGSEGDTLTVAGDAMKPKLIENARTDRRLDPVRSESFVWNATWSPAADALAFEVSDGASTSIVQVTTSSGRRLWSVRARVPSWSLRGMLAVQRTNRIVSLLSPTGKPVASVPGEAFTWSADGKRIAIVQHGRVELRRADGRLLSRHNSPSGVASISWAGRNALLLTLKEDWPVLYDLRSHATVSLGADSAASSHGRYVATVKGSNGAWALKVKRADASQWRTIAILPGCNDRGDFVSGLGSIMPLDDGSVVTETDCGDPANGLYRVRVDGSGFRPLRVRNDFSDPAFSPDGRRLAVRWAVGLCGGCTREIRAMTWPAGRMRMVATSENDQGPSWSPDGSQLLFVRFRTFWQFGRLMVASLDRRLHGLGVSADQAAWGPSRIAFIGPSDRGLWTIRPDGHDRRQVSAEEVSAVAWSSDGTLAWVEKTAGPTLVMRSTRGTRTRVSLDRNGLTYSISWAPDSRRIAFVAKPPDSPGGDVYVVDIRTRKITRITHDLGASSVAWRPR